ncbi:hypothetical protein KC19_3G134600 [Ceratodon purpureus]|uniref:Uncharacterized protein n=1 Tax=Ceratodon purpureus TaxID=3225 RepID=A0A8T0IKM3_CERPU|nr:hypothetical protein KC19_3G134600 [Ceratodon purpureus]
MVTVPSFISWRFRFSHLHIINMHKCPLACASTDLKSLSQWVGSSFGSFETSFVSFQSSSKSMGSRCACWLAGCIIIFRPFRELYVLFLMAGLGLKENFL